jgi:hypothetical protein
MGKYVYRSSTVMQWFLPCVRAILNRVYLIYRVLYRSSCSQQSLALFWHGNLQSYFLFFTMAGVHPYTSPELGEEARNYSCRIFEVSISVYYSSI